MWNTAFEERTSAVAPAVYLVLARFAESFKEGCNNIGVIALSAGSYKGVDHAKLSGSGGSMANLSRFVKQLRRERDRVAGQLSALNAALAAFVGVYKSKSTRKRRRKLSAAARRRISLAQKARWKKVRKS